MKEALSIETERTDDIPLLVTHIQRMQRAELLDKHFPTHGLQKGLSVGELTLVWLVHVLSQADHRMNRVQEWGQSSPQHPARLRAGEPDPFGRDR